MKLEKSDYSIIHDYLFSEIAKHEQIIMDN